MALGDQVFTQAQRDLLTGILNRIVPPAPPRPGAGDLGVGEFVEGVVGEKSHLRRLFNDGLVLVDITASSKGSPSFLALTEDAQDETLREVEAASPESFDQLVLQAYNGYYTHPTIFQQLEYTLGANDASGRPPDLLDETLLEQQRKRLPFWRETPS